MATAAMAGSLDETILPIMRKAGTAILIFGCSISYISWLTNSGKIIHCNDSCVPSCVKKEKAQQMSFLTTLSSVRIKALAIEGTVGEM